MGVTVGVETKRDKDNEKVLFVLSGSVTLEGSAAYIGRDIVCAEETVHVIVSVLLVTAGTRGRE